MEVIPWYRVGGLNLGRSSGREGKWCTREGVINRRRDRGAEGVSGGRCTLRVEDEVYVRDMSDEIRREIDVWIKVG